VTRLDNRSLILLRGGIFVFTAMAGPALGPTQPATQWIRLAFSGAKRLESEGVYLPSICTEVKNAWSCTSTRCFTRKVILPLPVSHVIVCV
jgi:hypothetical protein